jgi:hypothetical protein
MSDESVEAVEGIADVNKLSLRQLDDLDNVQRNRAVRQAFDRAAWNDDAMSTSSQQPEFSDQAI